MSKAVRIREHLYDEVAKRAKEERRSILAQLEVLLEQALRLKDSGAEPVATSPATAEAKADGSHPPVPEDLHFKPDFK